MYLISLDDCGGRVLKFKDGKRAAEYRVDPPSHCTCPSASYRRGKRCKHIEMVEKHRAPQMLTADEARAITKEVMATLQEIEGVREVAVADFSKVGGLISEVTLDILINDDQESFECFTLKSGLLFRLNMLFLTDPELTGEVKLPCQIG